MGSLLKFSLMPKLKIISDVTDRNRPMIFFGKRWKPRICPTEFFDFNSRYLENENEFFKHSFDTVFMASKSRDRGQNIGQLVSASQMTVNAGINFIHNHPPAHPRGFAPKICSHPGAFASQLLPGGRAFVGEGRAFVYKRFLPFLEFSL